MSTNVKVNFSRWPLVALVVIIIGILVWRLPPADLFFPSLAAGIVVAILAAWLIFRLTGPRPGRILEAQKISPPQAAGEGDEIALDPNLDEADYRNAAEDRSGYRDSKPRPPAGEVVARYLKMAEEARKAEEQSVWKPTPTVAPVQSAAPAPDEEAGVPPAAGAATVPEKEQQAVATPPVPDEPAHAGEPPIPLIIDQSSLTEENKIQLENAVWYRCENPYCKYTQFLEVHHIMDEKDGGNNKLENLVVLCPFCHDLAHKGEIPEKEMRDWVSQRDERFKAKLVWPF